MYHQFHHTRNNLNYTRQPVSVQYFLLSCGLITTILKVLPILNSTYSPIQLNSFLRVPKPSLKAFVTFLWIRDATWGYTKSTVPDHLITRTLFCPNLLLVLVHHSLSLSVRSKATLFPYQVYQSNSPSKPEQVSSGQNEGC